MAETVRIYGLREVQQKLSRFPDEYRDRVVYRALRRGAAFVEREARANAPYKSGALKKRGFFIFRPKWKNNTPGIIKISLSIATRKGDPFYGRFQELGWNTRGKLNEMRWAGRKQLTRTRRAIGSSRVTQPGRTDVLGKFFLDKAWASKRETAIRLIVRNSERGAEMLANEKGL